MHFDLLNQWNDLDIWCFDILLQNLLFSRYLKLAGFSKSLVKKALRLDGYDCYQIIKMFQYKFDGIDLVHVIVVISTTFERVSLK